jgi:hypothetical protein
MKLRSSDCPEHRPSGLGRLSQCLDPAQQNPHMVPTREILVHHFIFFAINWFHGFVRSAFLLRIGLVWEKSGLRGRHQAQRAKRTGVDRR